MSALTWIRKHIFRSTKPGRHRTEGLSTLEISTRAAASIVREVAVPVLRPATPVTEAERARAVAVGRVSAAVKPPTILVPVIQGMAAPEATPTDVKRAEETTEASKTTLSNRTDYVPRHGNEEMTIFPEDWTDEKKMW